MQINEIFLIILAVFVAVVFCIIIYKWLFTPRKSKVVRKSVKRLKRVDDTISYRENKKLLQLKLDIARFFGRFPIIRFSEEDREEVQKLIVSTDKRAKSGRLLLPEEIYINQLLIAGVIFVLCLFGMFISPFIICGILIIPFLMRIPIKSLESDREKFAVALADEFLAFYKLYYVQFIRPDNVTTLSYVINSYIPSASLEVKKILKVVDGDLAKGEEFALKRWDQRFPTCTKVHKFVAVAQARLKGDKSAYEAMDSLLHLLQEEHEIFFERERMKRERRIQSCINAFVLIGVTIVVVMSFIMMF